MPFTFTRFAPKTEVYQFGVLWFWKCDWYLCAGGREHTEEAARARADEHTATHREA